MSTPQKPLREAMPQTAAFIDAMREVFGRDGVDEAIRNGAQGGSDFHACENGHRIGVSRPVDPETSVSLDQMVVNPPKPKDRRGARGRA